MHGIAAGADSMDPVIQWIEQAHPGTYVKNVEIGDGFISSFIMPMDDQVFS
jgi:palmitoyl-protein thioesterase